MADDKVVVGSQGLQVNVDMGTVTRVDGTIVDRQRIVIGDPSNPLGLTNVDAAGNMSVTAGAFESLMAIDRAILRELQKLNFAIANLSTEAIYPEIGSDFESD